MEEMNDSKKHALMFLFTFIAAAVIIGTVIFPFWNLIREDVYEEVEILLNERDKCYVDTSDNIPKTIDNCIHKIGDIVTIKYGKDLAYAVIVNP
jgi:predicted nucleic-acid-binding protein